MAYSSLVALQTAVIQTIENQNKCDREQRTENRQTEKPVPEATLIPMDFRVERANSIFRFLLLCKKGVNDLARVGEGVDEVGGGKLLFR